MKYFIFIFIFLSLTFCSSSQPSAESSLPDDVANVQDLPKIQLGFNAKGSLQTTQQVAYTDKMLENLSQSAKKNLHIRVNGGTRSQKEMPSDWSDEQISAWSNLSKKHGVRLVFVVNGSDSPKSQLDFVKKWISAGAEFSFIEMMNEYYLVKFRKGDTSRDEVTRKITPEIYTREILPAFIEEFRSLNLPLFLICAPDKSGNKSAAIMEDWNRIVIESIKTYKDVSIGITIHLYDLGNKDFNYDQLDKIRSMLPAGTPIAITEAGTLDPRLDSENEGKAVFNHYAKIASKLKPGDYIFDQVLYTNYKKSNSATLHPSYKGLTPKGEHVLKFIKSMYPE